MLRSPGPGQLKTTPVTRGVRESSTAEAVESDNTLYEGRLVGGRSM